MSTHRADTRHRQQPAKHPALTPEQQNDARDHARWNAAEDARRPTLQEQEAMHAGGEEFPRGKYPLTLAELTARVEALERWQAEATAQMPPLRGMRPGDEVWRQAVGA